MEHGKITLKEAIAKGKLNEFIKERSDQKGDKDRFDSAISSMAQGKSKGVPAASKPESSDD